MRTVRKKHTVRSLEAHTLNWAKGADRETFAQEKRCYLRDRYEKKHRCKEIKKSPGLPLML